MTVEMTKTADPPALGRGARKVAQRRSITGTESFLWGAAGVAVVTVLWETAARLKWINIRIFSSPTDIVQSAINLWNQGTLMPALASTAQLFLVGFGISLVAGFFIGMFAGWNRRFNAFIDPWVSMIYASPRIAFIPLIAVWFGPGFLGQVVIVVLIAIFPVIINVASGVAAIDRDLFRMARSFLATNRDVLLQIALPGAVPAVASGIRQGMMQGLLGVVVAEYFLGNTGIGGLIFQAGLNLRTGQAIFGALVFAVSALILSTAFRVVEQRLDRWRA